MSSPCSNSNNTVKNKYPFITYLKAFAIIAIIVTHCKFTASQRYHVIFPFLIETAVPFFIVISGFNYSGSYVRHNVCSFTKMYDLNLLFKRVFRLGLPFTIIAVLQYLFIMPYYEKYHHKFSTFWINGAWGPGSYYFPMMMQLLALFPLIYWTVKKFKEKGVLTIFLLNFLFEFIAAASNMSGAAYRLFFFRFMIFAALGAYVVLYKDRIKDKFLNMSLMIGIVCISLTIYCKQEVFWPLINWKGTNMLSCFYVFPLFVYFYDYLKDGNFSNKIIDKTLTVIGNASWHIFLIQATYFSIINAPKFRTSAYSNSPFFEAIPLAWGICICLGILFYYIEKFILDSIIKFKNKTKNI